MSHLYGTYLRCLWPGMAHQQSTSYGVSNLRPWLSLCPLPGCLALAVLWFCSSTPNAVTWYVLPPSTRKQDAPLVLFPPDLVAKGA